MSYAPFATTTRRTLGERVFDSVANDHGNPVLPKVDDVDYEQKLEELRARKDKLPRVKLTQGSSPESAEN